MMNTCYTTIETSLGWLLLVERDGFLVDIEMPKPTREAALMAAPPNAVESPEGFGELSELLRLYFLGERVDFSQVPVSFEGLGEFETRVLRETMSIPHGKLVTYGFLAAAAGSPRAARAVGNAMSRNPLPIVVPCHRVIHSDGSIGGYLGGLDLKRNLLALEGITL